MRAERVDFTMSKDIAPLRVEEFFQASQNGVLVDVRTPSEFEKGHIPGAVNIPLFTDDERAAVGTLYKNSGRQSAVAAGLEAIGPRLAELAEAGKKAAKEGPLYLYCWRGGMRSSSVAWLWRLYGLNAVTLKNGYKSFRNHVLSLIKLPWKLLILGGKTGSRKTSILGAVAARGEQVIDLEALAAHKGSAFGNLGEKESPLQQQFENLLGAELFKLDLSRPVWVEDESRTIGRSVIPEEFWSNMRKSPVYYLDRPREERVDELIRLYGAFDHNDLESCIDKIERRVGGLCHKEMKYALHKGDLRHVCHLSLDYYDRAYEHGLSLRESSEIIEVPVTGESDDEVASMLLDQEKIRRMPEKEAQQLR